MYSAIDVMLRAFLSNATVATLWYDVTESKLCTRSSGMLKCKAVVARLSTAVMLIASTAAGAEPATAMRTGRVRVVEHGLQDDGGPFLGLGVSYFTALWRCRHDRKRLEADLDFLSKQGFSYYRMLSMVGYQPSWEEQEIAPVAFTNRDGKQVAAWPHYWEQLRTLVDLAYDKHGLRTQSSIFADAHLMPVKADRIEHMRRLLSEVVAGREHKLMLLEVANEAWKNGFPEEQGVVDLREFAAYLAERTEVPVAITSNPYFPDESLVVARDLRQTPEQQGYFAHSCHADRGTPWVTAKIAICGSVLTAG